ncbi:NAD(P)/FAD-dependent oxidoreductase, partial [Clostridium saudiense]|nr:NAD(P)/FAD-dependent oxidoreductase [Clostridium saudiense]
MKKVFIIGAGIGGLSIAARLLQYGFKVEIFEKNNTIGGKTNSIRYKDFNFDLTASIMMFPKNYIDLFLFCKEDYRDYFTTIPINDLYKVFYSDNSSYTFSTSLPSLTKTISDITGG